MDDPFDQFLNNLYTNYVDDVSIYLHQDPNPSSSNNSGHLGGVPQSFQKHIKEEPTLSPPTLSSFPLPAEFSSSNSTLLPFPTGFENPDENQNLASGFESGENPNQSISPRSSPSPSSSPSLSSSLSSPGTSPHLVTIKSSPSYSYSPDPNEYLQRKMNPMSHHSDSSPDMVESSESELSSPSSSGEGSSPPQSAAMQEILDLISWDDGDSFRPSKRKRESTNREAIKRKHNLAEQKRRIEMNDAIDSIRLLLPNGKDKLKATKLAILIEAYDYFKRIQELCCEVVTRNKIIEDQLKTYKKLYGPLRASQPVGTPTLNTVGNQMSETSNPKPTHQDHNQQHSHKPQPASHNQQASFYSNFQAPLQFQPNSNASFLQEEMMGLSTVPGNNVNMSGLRSHIPQVTAPKISNALFYSLCIFSVLIFSPLNFKSFSFSGTETSRVLLSESPLSLSSSLLGAPELSFNLFLWISVTSLMCFLFVLVILGIFCLTIHWAPIWYVSREKIQFIREEIEQGETYLSQGKFKEADIHFIRSLREMGLSIPDSTLLLTFCLVYQLIKRLLHVLSVGLYLEKWVMRRRNRDKTLLVEATKAYRGLLSRHKQMMTLRYVYLSCCGLNSAESSEDYGSLATIYATISFALYSMNTNSSSTIIQLLATYFQYRGWKVSSALSLSAIQGSSSSVSAVSSFPSSFEDSSLLSSSSSSSLSDQHLGQLYFVQGVSRLLSCRLKEAKFHLTRAFQLYSSKYHQSNRQLNQGQSSTAPSLSSLPDPTSISPPPSSALSSTYDIDQRQARICALSIGLLSEEEGNIRLSLSSYSYALHSSTQHSDSKSTIWSLLGLSRCYLHLNKPEISLQLMTELMKSNDLRHQISSNDLFIYHVLMSTCLQRLFYYEQALSLARQAVLQRKESNDSLFWIILVQPILTSTLLALLEIAVLSPRYPGDEDELIQKKPEISQTIKEDDKEGAQDGEDQTKTEEDNKVRGTKELRKEITEICSLVEEMLIITGRSAQNSPLIQTQRLRHKAQYNYLLAHIEEQAQREIEKEKERVEREKERARHEAEEALRREREKEVVIELSPENEIPTEDVQVVLLESHDEENDDDTIQHNRSAPISIPLSSSSPSFPSSPLSASPSFSTLRSNSSSPSFPQTSPSIYPNSLSSSFSQKDPLSEEREKEKERERERERDKYSIPVNNEHLLKAKREWLKALQMARSLSWEHEEQIIVSQIAQYSISLDH